MYLENGALYALQNVFFI